MVDTHKLRLIINRQNTCCVTKKNDQKVKSVRSPPQESLQDFALSGFLVIFAHPTTLTSRRSFSYNSTSSRVLFRTFKKKKKTRNDSPSVFRTSY